MVAEVVGWCVVVSAFEDTVAFAYMIGKKHPGLCVDIAHQFPRTPAGRTCNFDTRTGVIKPVSVIIGHSPLNFGWVRCRVYIGPLHPTNFSIVKILKVAVRIAFLLALVHLLDHPLILQKGYQNLELVVAEFDVLVGVCSRSASISSPCRSNVSGFGNAESRALR